MEGVRFIAGLEDVGARSRRPSAWPSLGYGKDFDQNLTHACGQSGELGEPVIDGLG